MARRSKSNNYSSPPVQEVTPEQLEAAVKACEEHRKAEEQKAWEKKMKEREAQWASLPSVKSVAVPQQPDTESVPLWKDILIWVFAVLTFLFYVCGYWSPDADIFFRIPSLIVLGWLDFV